MSPVALLVLVAIVAIAAGALAGGVTLAIGALFKVKRRRRRVLAAAVGLLVLAGAAVVERRAWGVLHPQGPESGDPIQVVKRAAQLAVGEIRRKCDERIQAMPEYQAWAEAERKIGVPEGDLLRLLRRVERHGVARLDGPNMAARVVITRHLMHNADERQCAGLLSGEISDSDLDALLSTTLSPGMVEGWFQVACDATIAELRQTPATPPDRERAAEALMAMAAALPDADRERMGGFFQSYSVASDHELCWYGRTIYDQLLKLKGGASTEFIRFHYAPPRRFADAGMP